ncbi:enoyl-CoA hydratase/isomerase family protein [Microlunatus soli]|uniref:enoyl-CoA hydratase n=1 Tax=Microlunatus soli TaxID=630515 RepID=A0A1H1XA69_9ACTN|nr:enoyl-CoA hydratase-related protein [Microlunatus soli]SDT06184.1 Enoyl-CoA hydratase/carnithine racemase [Microlunatus soli]
MTVRIERGDEHVAELVMDRPEALNAIDTQQGKAIAAACQELSADPTVRAVIISTALDKAFCVGADLKERNRLSDAELAGYRPVSRQAYAGVLGLAMPTIAAVEGYALGGGCELALSCDLIVASDTAVFALPEVGVGVIPGGGGTQLLSRRVGLNRALDLILTTRRVGADEAATIGLADRRAVAGGARAAAYELAAVIAAKSPVAIRDAKTAVRDGHDLPLADGLELEEARWQHTAFSADRAEGVAAFVEKRTPHWPG